MSRSESLSAFWPVYLSEHRAPMSRWLHFLGTSSWLACCAMALSIDPMRFGAGLVGMTVAAWHASQYIEPDRRPIPHVLAMLVLPALAVPGWYLAGVAVAYGCAWVGHFGVEGNRPATFVHPVWSLASDLRMWSWMVRGRLWRGDPLDDSRVLGSGL